MGFFTADLTLEHTTKVKGDVTLEQAIAAVQDHDFQISWDPNYVSHGPEQPKTDVAIPDSVKDQVTGETKCYASKDKVPGMYAKLLPGMGEITNHYRLTNTKDGVFVFLQAPLDVKIEKQLSVRQGTDGLELVERQGISGSKLLIGVAKGETEKAWKSFHASYVEKMGGQVGNQE